MNCKVSKYDICQLIQESWRDRKIIFPTTIDTSQSTFTYSVKRFIEVVFTEELTSVNNQVTLPNPLQDREGNYSHELVWNYLGKNYLVFQGQIQYTSKGGEGCGCDSKEEVIEVNLGDEIIYVTIDNIVGGGGGSDYTDGDAINISNNAINVKVDGTSVIVNENNELEAFGSGLTPEQEQQLSDINNKVDKVDGKGLSTNDFIPDGTTIVIGVDGKATAMASSYELPTASETVKGGVKIGNTLEVVNDVLNVKNNIIEYIHTGNKEVAVSSINYTTNTLTSISHGLVNGDRVAFNKTIDCNILTHTPFKDGWNVDYNGGGWFVVNATTNTFQLSLTSGGNPIALTERATNDFSKWKIEVQPAVGSISINNLNAISLEIEVVGSTFRNTRYLLNNQIIYNGYNVKENPKATETGVGALTLTDTYNIFTNHLIKVNVHNGFELIDSVCNSTKLVNDKIVLTKDSVLMQPIRNTPIINIPSLSFNFLKPMNGTKITIKKIK